MQALRRIVHTALTPALLAGVFAAPVLAAGSGWTTERDVDSPSYAVVEPRSSDLNIDALVLACEPADDQRVVQLQLYLTGNGPLIPVGAATDRLKTDPRAEISIDGKIFPVSLLFAGDHVVLADETQRMFPRLSERLLDALEDGATMKVSFDLLAEPARKSPAFDGEAVVELRAGAGGSAVAAVRRCGAGGELQSAALGPDPR